MEIIEVQEECKVDEENKWCVYCHTNKINGKKYFGITSYPVEERWKNGNGYKGQPIFWAAICKYGWDGFIHEVIKEKLNVTEAKNKETELIALYKTNCLKYNNPTYGYNCTDGGDSVFVPSDAVREKMSKAAKERLADPTNHPWYGKHLPPETIAKIKKTLTGKMVGENNPNFGNHKLAGANNPMYGKHPSEETKEKQRRAHLGKKASEETRQKLSEMRRGHKSARSNAVYCIELNELFWGQQAVVVKYNFNRCCIGDCCRGKQKSAGKHPITGEPLHWVYVYDQNKKDGSVIQGALTLGYVTKEQVKEYLNDLKKENDNYGVMEKE